MNITEIKKPSGTKTREKYGFFICDSNGLFNAHIGLGPKSVENQNDIEWSYAAYTRPTSYNLNPRLAEARILLLKELRDLAGFLEELDWTVKYLNVDENIVPCNIFISGNSIWEHIDVERGFKTKHRKSCDAIYKKYRLIFKQISDEWRREHAV